MTIGDRVVLRSEPEFNEYEIVGVHEAGKLVDVEQLTGAHAGHVWENQPARIFAVATK